MTVQLPFLRLAFLGMPIPLTLSMRRALIGFVLMLAVFCIVKLLLKRFWPRPAFTKIQIVLIAVLFGIGTYLYEKAQTEILFRPAGPLAMPVIFADLWLLTGPKPNGPCNLPEITAYPKPWRSATLVDGTTLLLPPEWRRLGVDSARTRFEAPPSNRINIMRERYAHGRSYLMYDPDTPWAGRTCKVDRGRAGAIWTFYEKDAQKLDDPRPFKALGDIIGKSGAWFSVIVSTPSNEERTRLVSLVTDATLLAAK